MCLCILHNFSNPEIRLDPATLVFWLTFQMVRLLFIMAMAKNPAMQRYDTISRNVTQSNNKIVNDHNVQQMLHVTVFASSSPWSVQLRVPRLTVWELPLCTFTQVCVYTRAFWILLTLSRPAK